MTSNNDVLIFGANGQIGSDLVKTFDGDYNVIPLTRKQVDLTNTDQIEYTINKYKPFTVINAAAFTNVDQAELKFILADKINNIAVQCMADTVQKYTGRLIHISTDYVYDGEKDTPYVERDNRIPINAYGKTKLDGELALQRKYLVDGVTPGWAIFRTSWIYSNKDRPNFLNTIRRIGKEHDVIKIVNDQIGSPTWSMVVAQVIRDYVDWLRGRTEPYLPLAYNVACSGYCSWYDFACKIVELENIDTKVLPITTDQFPTPAIRPKNSRLDCRTALGIIYNVPPEETEEYTFMPWQIALEKCLEKK